MSRYCKIDLKEFVLCKENKTIQKIRYVAYLGQLPNKPSFSEHRSKKNTTVAIKYSIDNLSIFLTPASEQGYFSNKSNNQKIDCQPIYDQRNHDCRLMLIIQLDNPITLDQLESLTTNNQIFNTEIKVTIYIRNIEINFKLIQQMFFQSIANHILYTKCSSVIDKYCKQLIATNLFETTTINHLIFSTNDYFRENIKNFTKLKQLLSLHKEDPQIIDAVILYCFRHIMENNKRYYSLTFYNYINALVKHIDNNISPVTIERIHCAISIISIYRIILDDTASKITQIDFLTSHKAIYLDTDTIITHATLVITSADNEEITSTKLNTSMSTDISYSLLLCFKLDIPYKKITYGNIKYCLRFITSYRDLPETRNTVYGQASSSTFIDMVGQNIRWKYFNIILKMTSDIKENKHRHETYLARVRALYILDHTVTK